MAAAASLEERLKEEIKRGITCTFVEGQKDSDSYTCPICLDLLKDPVCHPPCGNMFCSECVKEVRCCPLCRGSIEGNNAFSKVPRLILTNILAMNVVCERCHEVMSREVFDKSHREKCTCPCPFGCGCTILFSHFETHCKEGSCGKYDVDCPASKAPLLCEWHGPGGDAFREHVKRCVLVKLIPFVTSTQETINELKSAVVLLHETVGSLQTTVSCLQRGKMVTVPAAPVVKGPKMVQSEKMKCPICGKPLKGDNSAVNSHIDQCLANESLVNAINPKRRQKKHAASFRFHSGIGNEGLESLEGFFEEDAEDEVGEDNSMVPPEDDSFSMNTWKRLYLNNSIKDVVIPWFWNHFDDVNYSFWFSRNKYEHREPPFFKVCNSVTGWMQRVEDLSSEAFASICIFNERPPYIVEAFWIFKGKDIPSKMTKSVDFCLHNWERAGRKDRKKIDEFLAREGDFDGRTLVASKIFH